MTSMASGMYAPSSSLSPIQRSYLYEGTLLIFASSESRRPLLVRVSVPTLVYSGQASSWEVIRPMGAA